MVRGKNILVDVSVDFRAAALANGISRIDGVMITHAHQDHIGGIDDLRAVIKTLVRSIPMVMSKETAEELSIRFHYFMHWFEVKVLEEKYGEGEILDVPFRFISYRQQEVAVTGFCFGNLAYVTDIREYETSVFEYLQQIDTLILGAIHEEGTHMHFSLDEAVAFAKKTSARKVYLTHLSHEINHEKKNSELPPGFELAYDGLEVGFAFR